MGHLKVCRKKSSVAINTFASRHGFFREIRGKLHVRLPSLEQMDVVLTDLFDTSTLHNLNNISIDAKAFNQILKINKI